MIVALPPKVFQTLAPAIKGNIGVAREIKFMPFTKVFTGYFGCTVDRRKGNLLKVSPPPTGHGKWYWSRVPFFVHNPANGSLGRDDLYKLRKTFKDLYDWDHKTIVCSGGRE